MLTDGIRTAVFPVLLSCLTPRGLYCCSAFGWTYRDINDYPVGSRRLR